jgi:HSP20 family protein
MPWLVTYNPRLAPEGTPEPWLPPVDIAESEDGYRLWFEVPGVSAESLELQCERGVLRVSGERDEAGAAGAGRLRERRLGRFERALRLPPGVDTTAISAGYADGVLAVTLPKRVSARPRRIPVGGAPLTLDAK